MILYIFQHIHRNREPLAIWLCTCALCTEKDENQIIKVIHSKLLPLIFFILLFSSLKYKTKKEKRKKKQNKSL